MGSVRYTIDGVDFSNFGIYMSASDGIINRPKIKPSATYSWADYHGEDVDLKRHYYAPRDIKLSCIIKAESKSRFLENLLRFERVFDAPTLHRLQIDVDDKPLIYEVYCKEEISITKQWSEGAMMGTFDLKLTEPQPVKKVLKVSGSSCRLTMTTEKLVNVFWGDGSVDEDISGHGVTIEHTYSSSGTYYPVITGCIDEIQSINTNAQVVWDKL